MTGNDRQTISDATAKMLLEVKAVHFNAEKPFIFTSGWASPVYIDCRKLISFPQERTAVLDRALDLTVERIGLDEIDAIAGGETAGIPYAAWLAELTEKPMLYVRKKAKGFGRNARIEGDPRPGWRVLLVEDLATDGASKLSFADALREADMRVGDALVVFFYAIFPGALDLLAAHGLRLHYLATWWDVLAALEAAGQHDAATLASVRAFLADPVGWSAAHGGRETL